MYFIFKSLKLMVLFLGFLIWGTQVNSQSPANTYSVKAWWLPAAPPFSPVVGTDRFITFRLKAPKASVVNLLFGEWNIQPQPMQKDTAGDWSIKIGPVLPGIYSYLFSIDGSNTLDMMNPTVKTGTSIYSSIVEVTGDTARFDEIQNIPHGIIQIQKYISTPLKQLRNLFIYLPPDYFKGPGRKFPVLYLRHGGGDNETSWSHASGRADVILENLLAKKCAAPMIIVMPNCLTDGTWAGGSTKEGMLQLEQELILDIIPLIEKTYRILPGKQNRAIAGLSMGGGQAYIMGLRNLDKFSWIGEFSAGLLSDKDFTIDERVPGIFNHPDSINKQLKLLWIGCGRDDPRMPGHTKLSNNLNRLKILHKVYNVPGGHEWKVWREELKAFLMELFRT